MAWPKWLRRKDAPPQASAADMGFAMQFRELARDLVTLEINTIIKNNMTAERMPSVPNALLDIAREYLAAFVTMRVEVGGVFGHEPSDARPWHAAPIRRVPPDATDARFFVLPETVGFGRLFECLRWAAKNTRHHSTADDRPIRGEELLLLGRIETNADTLRSLLDRYEGLRNTQVSLEDIRSDRARFFPPYELTTRDFLIIRKVWEIGVERVVAQTSIQLDGDVVTRIAADVTADRDRADQILKIHRQGIETGVGNWRAIMDAAVAVVRGVTGSTDRTPSP